MKKIILLACAFFAFTGCASLESLTGQTPAQQIVSVDILAQDGTQMGVAALLAQHPEYRPYVLAANQGLGVAIAANATSPTQLQAYVDAQVPAAYQSLVNAALNAGLAAYQIWFTSEQPKLDANTYAADALQIAKAINAGCSAALVVPVAVPVVPPATSSTP